MNTLNLRYMILILFIIAGLLSLSSCVPPNEPIPTEQVTIELDALPVISRTLQLALDACRDRGEECVLVMMPINDAEVLGFTDYHIAFNSDLIEALIEMSKD